MAAFFINKAHSKLISYW